MDIVCDKVRSGRSIVLACFGLARLARGECYYSRCVGTKEVEGGRGGGGGGGGGEID